MSPYWRFKSAPLQLIVLGLLALALALLLAPAARAGGGPGIAAQQKDPAQPPAECAEEDPLCSDNKEDQPPLLTPRQQETLAKAAGPLPLSDRPAKRTRINVAYSRAVSRLIRTDAQVRCWSKRDWRVWEDLDPNFKYTMGFVLGHIKVSLIPLDLAVSYDNDKLQLNPRICTKLDRFTYKHWRPSGPESMRRVAEAMLVLAHEAQHVGGVDSESVAECFAVQRLDMTARLLGASASYARRISRIGWRYVHSTLPLAYANPRCRDGGNLDLDPANSSWPS